MKTGIELIAEERQEQIEKHGRTIDQDVKENTSVDKYAPLTAAARALLFPVINAGLDFKLNEFIEATRPKKWDIGIWSKMVKKPYKERLIIAGALIAAEIDRLNHSHE